MTERGKTGRNARRTVSDRCRMFAACPLTRYALLVVAILLILERIHGSAHVPPARPFLVSIGPGKTMHFLLDRTVGIGRASGRSGDTRRTANRNYWPVVAALHVDMSTDIWKKQIDFMPWRGKPDRHLVQYAGEVMGDLIILAAPDELVVYDFKQGRFVRRREIGALDSTKISARTFVDTWRLGDVLRVQRHSPTAHGIRWYRLPDLERLLARRSTARIDWKTASKEELFWSEQVDVVLPDGSNERRRFHIVDISEDGRFVLLRRASPPFALALADRTDGTARVIPTVGYGQRVGFVPGSHRVLATNGAFELIFDPHTGELVTHFCAPMRSTAVVRELRAPSSSSGQYHGQYVVAGNRWNIALKHASTGVVAGMVSFTQMARWMHDFQHRRFVIWSGAVLLWCIVWVAASWPIRNLSYAALLHIVPLIAIGMISLCYLSFDFSSFHWRELTGYWQESGIAPASRAALPCLLPCVIAVAGWQLVWGTARVGIRLILAVAVMALVWFFPGGLGEEPLQYVIEPLCVVSIAVFGLYVPLGAMARRRGWRYVHTTEPARAETGGLLRIRLRDLIVLTATVALSITLLKFSYPRATVFIVRDGRLVILAILAGTIYVGLWCAQWANSPRYSRLSRAVAITASVSIIAATVWYFGRTFRLTPPSRVPLPLTVEPWQSGILIWPDLIAVIAAPAGLWLWCLWLRIKGWKLERAMLPRRTEPTEKE